MLVYKKFLRSKWGTLKAIAHKNSSTVANKHLTQETDFEIHQHTKLLKVAVIGEPNAGKSTFINSLVNSQVNSIE